MISGLRGVTSSTRTSAPSLVMASPSLIQLLERQELARLAGRRSGWHALGLQDHVGRPFAGLSHSRCSSMLVAPMLAPALSMPVIW